jgi:hypothetical protein
MTWFPSSIDNLQSAYNSSPLVTIAGGTPIALTTSGATEVGISLFDSVNTTWLLGDGIVIPPSTVAAPGLRFGGDFDTGLYTLAKGILGITSSGVRAASIGKAAPSSASGIDTLLDVEIDPTAQSGTAGWALIQGNAVTLGNGSGTHHLLDLKLASTTQIYIDSDGAVGLNDGFVFAPTLLFSSRASGATGIYAAAGVGAGSEQIKLAIAGRDTFQFLDSMTTTILGATFMKGNLDNSGVAGPAPWIGLQLDVTNDIPGTFLSLEEAGTTYFSLEYLDTTVGVRARGGNGSDTQPTWGWLADSDLGFYYGGSAGLIEMVATAFRPNVDGNGSLGDATKQFGNIFVDTTNVGNPGAGGNESFVTTVTGGVQTPNATPAQAVTITLATNTTYWIEARVIGRNTDTTTERAFYVVRALVYRQGGGATLGASSPEATFTDEDDATWAATLTVNGNDVRVTVTGDASDTVEWAAELRYQSVAA